MPTTAGSDYTTLLTSTPATDPVLESLKQKGVVCGTLAEWLQQQLGSSTAQGPGALQLEQHSAALSRVLVADEWSDELAALLTGPNYRQVVFFNAPCCGPVGMQQAPKKLDAKDPHTSW